MPITKFCPLMKKTQQALLVILIYIHQETNPAQLLVFAPVGGWH
jgi:hypothetical protein